MSIIKNNATISMETFPYHKGEGDIMKKINKILTFGLSLGLLGGVLVGVSAHKKAAEATATDPETYIPMDLSFFGLTEQTQGDLHGKFRASDATYWNEGHSFNALDTFFDGCNDGFEGWTGEFSSRSWQQSTRYVYFTWGCAQDLNTGNANDEGQVKLRFHYGNNGDYADMFNNTFYGVGMMLRYFEVPSEFFEAQNGQSFPMWIEFIDHRSGDYGAHVFGYLHVNQTMDQVGDACRYFVNNLRNTQADLGALRNHYYTGNASLRTAWNYATTEPFIEQFESNEDFQHSFYYDYGYGNNDWMEGRHPLTAISDWTYRPEAANNMPFNKTGTGFFKGWYQDGSGYVESDVPIYRFVSKPFVLSGTGLVSIKLGGTASLHIIDAATKTELAYADVLTYNRTAEGNQNLATSEFNTVTMIRHVVNLEAYLGRAIQVGIADIKDHGWSALYADELVTYYASYPGFKVDVFTQTNNSGTFNAYRTDKYINSTVYNGETNPTGLKYVLENEINKANDNEIINHIDNSAAKAAYDFLQTYYSTLRAPANQFDYSKVASATQRSLVDSYKALSSDARTVVMASTDILYPAPYVNDWWTKINDVSKTLSVAFAALVEEHTFYSLTIKAGDGEGDDVIIPEIKGEYTLKDISDFAFTAPEHKHFVGWKVNGEGNTLEVGEDINIAADTQLVAQYAVDNHTVSFVGNNGKEESMSSETVAYGSEFALPSCTFTAPDGKQFAGWQVGSDTTAKAVGTKIQITGDVVLTALWEDVPEVFFTVSFAKGDESADGTMADVQVGEGLEYSLPECEFTAPAHKEFAGWFVNDETTLRQPGDKVTVNANVTLTAQWKNVKYTVTIDPNNGEATSTEQVEYNSIFELPVAPTTAPEHKQFAGWKVGIDETLRQPGYELTVTGNVTVTAQWEFIKHTITYDKNGGEGATQPIYVNEGEDYTLPNNWLTAPEGMEFAGWKVGDSTFIQQPGYTFAVEEDVTITAQWKHLKFAVSFANGGGTGSMDPVEKEYGSTYALPANGFTAPEGKRFIGWLVGTDETLRQPGYEITVTANVTITAQWENIPTFTVSFAANGGSGDMPVQVLQEGSKYTLPANGFTAPEGKRFIGWKVGDEEELRQPGYQITVNANVTVTAQWEDIPVVMHTVTFVANGGSGEMEALQVKHGDTIELPACTFTAPEGKVFDCWLVSANKYQVGEKITVTSDMTFKASWKDAEEEKPSEEEPAEEQEQQQEQQQGEASVATNILNQIKQVLRDILKKILKAIRQFMFETK